MSRFFSEMTARERAADWRREADRHRLLDLRPRPARALPARLMATLRLHLGRATPEAGEAVAAESQAAQVPAAGARHSRPAPQDARLAAVSHGAPPTQPQRR